MKFFENKKDISFCGGLGGVYHWYSDPYLWLTASMGIFFVGVSLFYIPRKVYRDEILSKEQKWYAMFFLIISWICIGLIPLVPTLLSSPLFDVLNSFLPALFLLPHFFYVAKYGGITLSLIVHISLIATLIIVLDAALSQCAYF